MVREGNPISLVAGERRLRAIKDLHVLSIPFRCNGAPVPPGLVPTVTLGELTPIAALEAELEENVQRVDLSWQERSTALARLAEVRAEQAALAGNAPPTVSDLAIEVRGSSKGDYRENTRRELILARHLDNPEVAKAKSVDEAFKLLLRQEQTRKNELLAEQYGRDFTSETHTLRHGDATGLLATLPPSSYDVLITDPPYGIGADEFGDSGGRTAGAHQYDDGDEALELSMKLIFEWAPRVLKPESHIYVFCDIDRFSDWCETLRGAGFKPFRTPLVWHKPNGVRAPWPEQGPLRRYELIAYAVRGNRPVLKLAGDVLTFPVDNNLGHRAQKPVALYQELLSRSARPGDAVLDPFAGTGPVFPAAHALKLRATGFEIDPAFYAIARTRLEGLK